MSVENLTENEIRRAMSKGRNISEHYISKNLINAQKFKKLIYLKEKITLMDLKNIEETKKLMKAGIKFIHMDTMFTYLKKKL